MSLLSRVFNSKRKDRKTQRNVQNNSDKWSQERVLMNFGNNNYWTLKEATNGTFVFGGTGSGKTTGIGAALSGAFLAAEMGGLVLCAKKSEPSLWESYCKRHGRSEDLIIISEDGPYRFNFLDYELNRKGAGAGKVENIVRLFMVIMEMGDGGKGSSDNKDRFWDKSLEEMLTRAVFLLKKANGKITVHDLYRLITSAPKSYEHMASDRWKETSFCSECLEKAAANVQTDDDLEDYKLVLDYWTETFCNLDEKTRSIILVSFTGLANSFISGPLRRLFSSDTTITPEVILDGKIIVLDFPVHEYDAVGIYAQGIIKYMTQKAMERRDITENNRPVFIWADEAQFFINSHDAKFMTTARSSSVAACYMTQNISNVYSVMNGRDPKDSTNSLLANFLTKVFHANNDSVTNNWAAETIGKQEVRKFGGGANNGNGGNRVNINFHQELRYPVEPYEFTTLRNGGYANDLTVQGIMTVAGKVWSNGKNFLKVSFKQGN